MKKFQLRSELQQDDHQLSLQYLKLLNLPSELHNMPHTGASLHLSGKLPLPSSKTMKLLFKKSAASTWTHHLAFLVLILAASGKNTKTVYSTYLIVQKILIKYQKHIVTLDEDKSFKPDLTTTTIQNVFRKILHSNSLTDATKFEWFSKYQRSAKATLDWFERHKESLGFAKLFYANLILPPVTDDELINHGKKVAKTVEMNQKANRKLETDELFPHFKILYAEANIRLNLFERFYDAARQAENYAIENKLLTYGYSYKEGDIEIRCKIVHINFLLKQLSKSSNNVFVRKGRREKFSDFIEPEVFKSSEYLVNICNHHELDKELFWFVELAEAHLFYNPLAPTRSKYEKFCRGYEYGQNYFYCAYITRASRTEVPRALPAIASEYLNSLFISHHELRLIFNIAAFALEFFLTSGARISETLQIAVHPDVLKKVQIPRLNKPGEYIERYVVLLTPKGHEEPAPYFLTDATFSSLNRLSKVVAHTNAIFDGSETIFSVTPDKDHPKYFLLAKRPYIFQVDGMHLDNNSFMTMLKLLLHNIVAHNSENGRFVPVKLKAHLFRHIFATHVVHVEKLPLDVVAKMLNQKHLPTTAYYSEPTMSVIAHHHTNITENMLHHLNLEEEAKRLPSDMITLYEGAKQASGTLTEVLGGTCTAHGQCPAKTACVGCGSKVPTPSKRDEIERKMQWANQEKEWHHRQGLIAEERKMDVLIRDCKTELWEMDQIEIYLAGRDAKVQIFDSKSVPLKWVDTMKTGNEYAP